eukprot:2156576-Rhodomonas_salina.3
MFVLQYKKSTCNINRYKVVPETPVSTAPVEECSREGGEVGHLWMPTVCRVASTAQLRDLFLVTVVTT